VQSALIEAHAEYWGPLVRRALDENKRRKLKPATYAGLADMLNRDWANFWRWRKGEHAPSVQDMLSLANLLRIPVSKLLSRDFQDYRRTEVSILRVVERLEPILQTVGVQSC
jgi:hypothetical protein